MEEEKTEKILLKRVFRNISPNLEIFLGILI